ncbi:hypothetical protein ACJX0J_025164, partial [Zea mays]
SIPIGMIKLSWVLLNPNIYKKKRDFIVCTFFIFYLLFQFQLCSLCIRDKVGQGEGDIITLIFNLIIW